jgi:murein DD-endopeptidase MepM/ murein hydrolase activator NlpD
MLRRGHGWAAIGFSLLLLSALLAVMTPRPAQAQEPPASPTYAGTYTVVAGDTLAAIAARFDVPLDALVELNQIADPALIQVGQELLIPGKAALLLLGVGDVAPVYARPGETLGELAARLAQDPEVLAAVNDVTVTARLFPGQPISAPVEAIPPAPLRFGSVTGFDRPAELEQGHTGYIRLTSARPLSPTVAWDGLALPLFPIDGDPTRLEALLPSPAVQEPGPQPITVTYATRRGVPVTRTWTVEVLDGGYGFQTIQVPEDRMDSLDPAIRGAEEALLATLWEPVTPSARWRSPFVRPLGPEYATTSPFGTRRDYNNGLLTNFHSGQDFGAPVGAPVSAPITGTVVFSDLLTIFGHVLVLDHGNGVYTAYFHLSKIEVAPGETVAPGQAIAQVGNSGRSTGPHLHWELRIDGVAVDPMQFLDQPLWPGE